MKQLAFVILAATATVASPLYAQSAGTAGNDFVEAVKKSDGDKATSILEGHPHGIVDTRDGEGNTGLIIAISRSDETWTGYLLNKGADPNLGGKGGDTPLISASRVGFEQAAQWLIALGAKVDATNRMGETPLIIAVQQRELPMARMLLDAGANPDRSDAAAGYSARDYATRDPRARDILKLIQDKKPKAAAAK
ncbi:ankyrin repeat domain-containing protein [Sphingomonas sp.]|uniref:ankyrin repeat domain-containing protein n=1 Tax=Sphingomonas sp. TaxID=28214 RepID=UPI0038A6E477